MTTSTSTWLGSLSHHWREGQGIDGSGSDQGRDGTIMPVSHIAQCSALASCRGSHDAGRRYRCPAGCVGDVRLGGRGHACVLHRQGRPQPAEERCATPLCLPSPLFSLVANTGSPQPRGPRSPLAFARHSPHCTAPGPNLTTRPVCSASPPTLRLTVPPLMPFATPFVHRRL